MIRNVTFLTGEYPPMQGGIADHTAYLAQHLAGLGIQSTILTSRRWTETTEGTSPRHQPGAPVVHPVLPRWDWRCWRAVARYLARQQPDVLHIQYQAAAFNLGGWINGLPWYLRRRKKKTVVITTFHDLRVPYMFPKAGPLRYKAILTLARHSDAVICTNREDLARLSASKKVTHGKTTLHGTSHMSLIPLGSNVEPQPPANFDRDAWRSQLDAGPNTLLLAYFGFLNQSKGGEELIEALALLRRQGVDARLLLIGGDVGHVDPANVEYARRVQALIERHGLAGVVHRTGYVSLAEVSAHLLAADAVVMPYRDGVSFRRTTLIAALRHGCPVISTEPANPRFVPEIRPGENILLAPPANSPALAQTIAQLVEEPLLRQILSAEGKRLGDLFDWTEIAGQTAALYQTVINNRP